MRFKIIFLLFLIILLTCSTALATENTSVIPGVGTITFPAEVEVSISHAEFGIVHDLLVNDKGVWRTGQLFFTIPIPGKTTGDLKDPLNSLDTMLSSDAVKQIKNSPSARLLESPPINELALSNERLILKSTKVLLNKWVMHSDYYAINTPTGVRMLVLLCADGDGEYWRSVVDNVIVSLQR